VEIEESEIKMEIEENGIKVEIEESEIKMEIEENGIKVEIYESDIKFEEKLNIENNGDEKKVKKKSKKNFGELLPEHLEQLQRDLQKTSEVVHEYILDLDGQTIEYGISNTPKKAILYWKGNKNCTFSVSRSVSSVKVFIQECDDCIFNLEGKVLTGVVELWKCNNIVVNVGIDIGTFQVDISNNITLSYEHKNFLDSLVQAGVDKLIIQFKDSEADNFVTGVTVLKQQYNDYDEIDQFITRWIKNELLTERLVRIEGGFPTTDRELEFNEQKKQEESLGETEKKNEQEEMDVESLSNLKKLEGNKAFTVGNYEIAIQRFTEAIELTPQNHILYSNRALCYIKLKEWEKGLVDTTKCVELNNNFAKGHYRSGVCLLELNKLNESHEELKIALELAPEDKDVIDKLEIVKKLIENQKN